MTNNDLALQLGEHTSKGWLLTFYEFKPSFFAAIKSATWDAFFSFNRDATYNTVLWTMGPEFLGSLFLFSFLGLLGSKKIRWGAYPIIVVVLFFRQTHWLNAFVLGIGLCDLYVNTELFPNMGRLLGNTWLQIISGLIIIVLIGAPNYLEIFHLGIAVLLVSLSLSVKGYARFFSSHIPVYLGKISFSLYLIHVPILCSATGFIYISLDNYISYPASALITSVATIAISILAANIFYEYGDKQGIVLGGKLANYVKNND